MKVIKWGTFEAIIPYGRTVAHVLRVVGFIFYTELEDVHILNNLNNFFV